MLGRQWGLTLSSRKDIIVIFSPSLSDILSSSRNTKDIIQTACTSPEKYIAIKIHANKRNRQISTNGGRGSNKKGLDQQQHVVAYTDLVPPDPLPGETHLNKAAIKIELVNPAEKLDPTSRINVGKVYPVEHNIRVCEVGMVTPSALRTLQQYYKQEQMKDLRD